MSVKVLTIYLMFSNLSLYVYGKICISSWVSDSKISNHFPLQDSYYFYSTSISLYEQLGLKNKLTSLHLSKMKLSTGILKTCQINKCAAPNLKTKQTFNKYLLHKNMNMPNVTMIFIIRRCWVLCAIWLEHLKNKWSRKP